MPNCRRIRVLGLVLSSASALALSCAASRENEVRDQPGLSARDVEIRAQLLRAEDRRLVDEPLLGALRNPLAEIRALAVRTLGRIGAESRRLEEALLDPDGQVRAEAAYALGLLGDGAALPALHEAARDEEPRVRASVADSLGLLGNPLSSDELLALLADEDPTVALAACLAVARHSRADFAVAALLRQIEDPASAAAMPALYALARLASRPLAIAAQEKLRIRRALLALAEAPRPEVRALVARGLAAPISPDEQVALGRMILDPEPLVRVEAVGSLGFPGGTVRPYVAQALKDGDERVVLAAVRAISRMQGPEPLEALARLAFQDSRLWLRRQAILAMSAVEPEGAAEMANGLSKSPEPELRQAAATLLQGRKDGPSVLLATRLFEDSDPRVRAAAIPALAGAAEPLGSLLGGLADQADAATRIAIAEAVEHRIADENRGAEDRADALALLERLRSGAEQPAQVALAILAAAAAGDDPAARRILEAGLDSPHHQVRLRAIRHLHEVFGEDRSEAAGPAADRPLDDYVKVLEWAARPRAAKVTVERPGYIPGQFTLRLDTENAPLTCWNFAELAGQGFFNGLEIHRVVPAFVVQDGDPQGDGKGGPGYMIRDEVHRSLFLGGTLGMATGGKDTGGSQWFITLTPQFHLNGRYTPFGQVVQNFPGVVSLLLPGDRVVAVEVYEGDGTEELPPPETL